MTLAELRSKHAPTLEAARTAIERRTYFSAYPEDPRDAVYGSGSREAGESKVRSGYVDQEWPSDAATLSSDERSLYGQKFRTHYADESVAGVVDKAQLAATAWAAIDFEDRASLVLEILEELQGHAFEMAYACMQVCGQPFAMAFQAGTAHALDRSLEAIAYAVREMKSVPRRTIWEKPGGKKPVRIEKSFDMVPRGVAAVIGCSTFPTWNSYPGTFASLVSGNPVIIKPHPTAVLPLALFVEVARGCLEKFGVNANVVQLLVDTQANSKTKELALDSRVMLIDFTGSSEFGDWLEANAKQAHVFTEKAGVNAVLIESTDDFEGMVRNLAVTLTLYSGQMCTTPQSIYIPNTGVATSDGTKTVADFEQALGAAIEKLTADPARAIELTGVIQSDATLGRIDACRELGKTSIATRTLAHPSLPDVQIRTPALYRLDISEDSKIGHEYFGPISILIEVDSAQHALEHAERITLRKGAITWSVYSTSEDFIAIAKSRAGRAGVHLTVNMTGPILVNQSAAFSDFHVSGHNSAGNASICDANFVLPRFRVHQTRRYLA